MGDRVEYDIGTGESVSTAVVRAVSAVKGCDPTGLDPLAESVDPDALDSLFTPREDGTPRTGGTVSFLFNGCRIRIDNGEYLALELLDDRFIDSRQIPPKHE